MMLLDTNVLIYASDTSSRHCIWASRIIANVTATEGAVVNAVVLAEIMVGEEEPETVEDRIRRWGVGIRDVPAAAAGICADAYRKYRRARKEKAGSLPSGAPLPDFFIGAHAQAMGWRLATADTGRFKTYFPSVRLTTP